MLLIDEATPAITEALHRIRGGSLLDDRDLAAAKVALSDLFGGLGQLAALLAISVAKYAESDHPLHVGPLEDRLQTLRMMTLSAQQAATGLQLGSAAIRPTNGHETIPLPRDESGVNSPNAGYVWLAARGAQGREWATPEQGQGNGADASVGQLVERLPAQVSAAGAGRDGVTKRDIETVKESMHR